MADHAAHAGEGEGWAGAIAGEHVVRAALVRRLAVVVPAAEAVDVVIGAVAGAVIVTTPQKVALADAVRGVQMFRQPQINVPVLGIVENMAYFTPAELPDNKYYIFGREGARMLADDLQVPFLGEIPLVQSIREAGDIGHPAALQEGTPLSEAFDKITQNVVQETVRRNTSLPPTEAIKITTMAGCSAVKG